MMGYSQNRSNQKNLFWGRGFNHGSSVGADSTLESFKTLTPPIGVNAYTCVMTNNTFTPPKDLNLKVWTPLSLLNSFGGLKMHLKHLKYMTSKCYLVHTLGCLPL